MTDAYAKAGVNISEATRAVDLMKAAVKSTHDARVIAGVGAQPVSDCELMFLWAHI